VVRLENHTTICVGYQGYTRHRRKTNKGKPHHNMWWTPRVYKTKEKEKQRKTTSQYVLDTKSIQDTGERQAKENPTTIVSCIPLVSNTYCGVVFI
jgi:hypothetical protein